MINYLWPVCLVILSNVLYQICAKAVPDQINPLASLTVTYLVGALISLLLYFLLNKDANILREYQELNWAPFGLGTVIVGLEVGFIYAYKAGWPVSLAQIVTSVVVGIFLVGIGYLLYKEAITWNKLLGILICLLGLGLINWK